MYQNGNGVGEKHKITYRLNLSVTAIIAVNGNPADRKTRTVAVSNLMNTTQYQLVASALNDLHECLSELEVDWSAFAAKDVERMRADLFAFAQPRTADDSDG